MAETFADWLAARLQATGLEQADLARTLAVDPSTVSNWLAGKRVPKAATINLVAETFHEHPDSALRAAGKPSYAARVRPPDQLADIHEAGSAVCKLPVDNQQFIAIGPMQIRCLEVAVKQHGRPTQRTKFAIVFIQEGNERPPKLSNHCRVEFLQFGDGVFSKGVNHISKCS